MFNFKRPEPQPAPLDADLRARLDSIEQHLNALGYHYSDIKRTLTRIETKLTRMAIAAGYGDIVQHSQPRR